jgi:hypothetical protein
MARGASGEIGLYAEVGAAPVAERLHERHQLFALGIEGVGGLRRNGSGRTAIEHAVPSQLAQLVSQHLFRNLRQLFAQFGEAPLPAGKVPKDLPLPFAREHVDGGLHGTSVMIFHRSNP